MIENINTLIIGGGQAGLSTSYYLKEQGIEHIILDKSDRIANNWRNERWDSFTLVTPNWALFRIPGSERNGESPDGFMPREKVVKFFENYVEKFKLPVQFKTQVTSVEVVDNNGYLVQTNKETYKVKNVVVAAGLLQKPKLPSFVNNFSSDIFQIHSSKYKNPGSIPEGAVLIVGSGQSGCQITEELYKSRRKVFLCTGTAGRIPRRYRGKDIIEWLEKVGMFETTPEQLPPGMSKFYGIPQLSGANGGRTINLHQFARDGVTLLGHLQGTEKHKAIIAPDLHKNLEMVDQFEVMCTNFIDEYISKNNLDIPAEELPKLKDGYNQQVIEELDLKKEGINSVIWANGYTFDFSFVKLPVFDVDGFPIQKSGVTDYPGLYFVGLPWMPSEKSGFLVGVAWHAKYISDHIAAKEKTSPVNASGMVKDDIR
jgi:putative flavoprotein involved in K+ transport